MCLRCMADIRLVHQPCPAVFMTVASHRGRHGIACLFPADRHYPYKASAPNNLFASRHELTGGKHNESRTLTSMAMDCARQALVPCTYDASRSITTTHLSCSARFCISLLTNVYLLRRWTSCTRTQTSVFHVHLRAAGQGSANSVGARLWTTIRLSWRFRRQHIPCNIDPDVIRLRVSA